MLKLGAEEAEIDQMLAHLEAENFLNEVRFATAFTRGKFIYKKWGRQKIRYELRQKQVPNELIEAAIEEEIDDESYAISMRKLMRPRIKKLTGKSIMEKKSELSRFLVMKGYESGLMSETIEAFLKEEDPDLTA
ncbi:MAG: regulatory protein RecX [Bacteroidota bacterium]